MHPIVNEPLIETTEKQRNHSWVLKGQKNERHMSHYEAPNKVQIHIQLIIWQFTNKMW